MNIVNNPNRIFWLVVCLSTTITSCALFRPQLITQASKTAANKSVQAQAMANLAAGYIELGRYDIAKAEATKALELDPYSSAANNVNGLLYLKLGNKKKAENYLSNAVRLDPENPQYQNNLALLYCQSNRAKDGMRLLQKALSNRLYVNPQNSIMNAGICSENLGNFADAEKYYRKSMTYKNFRLHGKEKLAGLYLKTNRNQQAWSEVKSLFTELNPPSPKQYELIISIANAVGEKKQVENYQHKLKSDYPEYTNSKYPSSAPLTNHGSNGNYGAYQQNNVVSPRYQQHPYPSAPTVQNPQNTQYQPYYQQNGQYQQQYQSNPQYQQQQQQKYQQQHPYFQ